MKILSNKVFIIAFIVGAALGAVRVFATSPNDIVFPVAELGNCQSKESCRLYCEDSSHMLECIAFAEKHNFMDSAQAAEARKFAALLRDGGPGGCRSPQECRTFCENENNRATCFEFASRHGLMDSKTARHMRQIEQVLKGGIATPGGCRSAEACRVYCENLDRIEECIAFGQTSGLFSPAEAEQARRSGLLFKNKETPGACQSPGACQTYCADPANVEECVEFAERHDILESGEIEKFRKTRGRGPGGCQGPQECERFCNISEHQDVCLQFAREHGLIEEESIERIKNTSREIRNRIDAMPPELVSCLRQAVGEEVLERIQSGMFVPSPELAQRMHACMGRFLEQLPSRSFEPPVLRTSPARTPGGRIEIKFEDSSASEPDEFEREIPEEYQKQFENYRGYYTNLPEPSPQPSSSFFQSVMDGLANLLRGW